MVLRRRLDPDRLSCQLVDGQTLGHITTFPVILLKYDCSSLQVFHGAGVSMLRLKLLVVAGCSCSFCWEILGGFDQNGSRRQLLSMCSDCWNRQTVSCSPVKRQHVSRWFTFADFPQGSCLICALRNVARGVTHAKIAVQQAIVPRHGVVRRMNAKNTM